MIFMYRNVCLCMRIYIELCITHVFCMYRNACACIEKRVLRMYFFRIGMRVSMLMYIKMCITQIFFVYRNAYMHAHVLYIETLRMYFPCIEIRECMLR